MTEAYLSAEDKARVEIDRMLEAAGWQHFTLKQNPLRYEDLEEFVAAFAAREESERFPRFTHEELIVRDKVSLDITWLRDESLEDADNLPPPEVIAAEIVEDLEAALAEFAQIAQSIGRD